eukprot:Plantae.Rhodophyta-Palmaria_palmata.ctg3913.p2 GENE.Plantae.Rhodophyta-Palmaria_palmata.ctg3913~~Plantae.Rhodophyta-Palmaria_palmata.ctg3913.p2  ORF type:complete len:124 (-),score=12.32 Plantae.Rhodophyta-Palmaria_palmata.ctg3913:596-967(-)
MFYETAHDFSVHLCKEENLSTDMGSKCPKETTRWLAMGNMLKWMIVNRRSLLLHLESRSERAPGSSWWLRAAGVQSALRVVSFTFKSLETHEITVCQQRKEITNFIETLAEHAGARPCTAESF